MSRVSEQADQIAEEQKAAAVQEISRDIFVATGELVTGPLRQHLFRLYDRAREDGRQSGIAQAGIMLGQAAAREPWRPGEPCQHAILSELAKLAPGHEGLTLGELTTLVRAAGWDVSRMNVRYELSNLADAGLVRYNLPVGEQPRYVIAR